MKYSIKHITTNQFVFGGCIKRDDGLWERDVYPNANYNINRAFSICSALRTEYHRYETFVKE